MSINVKNLSKVYGSQKAVNDITFSVQPGEILGFLGPNGAGKSTTMKILTCFLPQTQGSAQVCGYDVTTHPMEVRRHIGYLPEHNPLYLDMYVREYLQFTAKMHGLKEGVNARVDEIIEKTGIVPERKKKIGQLSKGYRQRVGLAQALLHDPEVLILDEPTSGLDPNQISEIRNLIRETGKDRTVILSTHIMQEVEAICSRVIIINKGKIVADESVDKMSNLLVTKPKLTVEFDGHIEVKQLKNLQGVESIDILAENKFLIQCESNTDVRNDLFKLAVASDASIIMLQKEESKLEDIFKQLTNIPA